jgi:hypothetical protein
VIAETQAHAASESAEAASKQAYAAVDSARSARESVDLSRATLYRADQPRFELSSDSHENGKLAILVRMVAEPPEASATGKWVAGSVRTGGRGGPTDR